MKFLFDLFPVILFFATYKLAGHPGSGNGACLSGADMATLPLWQEPILLATVVAIVATFCQVGWLLFRRQKVDTMLWISLSIIVVFGGATLYFRNPAFIQWKPSVLYWSFAAVLLLSDLVLHKNLVRNMMETQIKLPDPVWSRLNAAWVAFMAGMGGANLAAVKWLSCDGWVSFKLYGLTGLMFVFIIGQGLALNRYVITEEGAQ